MFDNIYNIISMFVILHPIITVYLMGSLVSIGVVYSLMSYGYLNPIHRKRMFIEAFMSSWIVTVVFLYGFFSSIFKNDREE